MNFENFMKQTLDFATEHWGILSTLLYEFLTRVIPTKKNLSLIDNGLKILGFILKNRKSGGGAHKILFIALLFMSCTSFAQLNQSAKSYRSFNADSLTVRTEVSGLQLMYENVGALYYNRQSSKWRIFYDSAWHDLLGGGGGGGTYTAGNGMTLNGTAFDLGATSFASPNVTQDTWITDDETHTLGFRNFLGFQLGRFYGGGDFVGYQYNSTNDNAVSGEHVTILGIDSVLIQSTGGTLPSLSIGGTLGFSAQNIGGGTASEILYIDGDGKITRDVVPGGTVYTSNNAVTKTGDNFQLGGALIKNTDITGAFQLNLGTTGSRIGTLSGHYANLDFDDDSGAEISMTTGNITLKGGSGNAVDIVNDIANAHAFRILKNGFATTNARLGMTRNSITTTGTAAVGFGFNEDKYIEDDGGSLVEMANDQYYLSDATAASPNADFKKQLRINNVITTVYEIATVSGTAIHTQTGTLNNIQALKTASASTAGGTITLDFSTDSQNAVQKIFTGSASWSSAKVLAFSNAGNALSLDFHFEVTNVAGTLELPSNCVMADVNFNTTTQIWTPPATGQYELTGTYDGTNWKIKISGPYL